MPALAYPAAKLLARQVREGRSRSQAEEIFYARFAPDRVKPVDISESPILGAESAKVTVVEWADFECPACRHAAPLFEKLVADHPGKVRFVFKFYPLAAHPHGESAARAVAAADKQGKLWQMHHAVFEHHDALEPRDIERYAKELGLDVPRFRADWESEPIADRVARDRKQGEKLGVDHTPTLFIDGREFAGGFDQLGDWVELDMALAEQGQLDVASKPAVAASAAPSASAPGRRPGKSP